MSDSCVGVVIFCDNFMELCKNIFEVFPEKFGLYFSNFVKLHQNVFEYSLIVILECFESNSHHCGQ